jgi:hypothetical protein
MWPHRSRHQSRRYQLADAAAGHRGVVGDDRQAALALAHQFVDQPFRGANTHEAADHQLAPSGIMATD